MKFERKLYRRHQVQLGTIIFFLSFGDIQGSDEGEQIERFSDEVKSLALNQCAMHMFAERVE